MIRTRGCLFAVMPPRHHRGMEIVTERALAAYSAATIALYSRLWLELEGLSQRLAASDREPSLADDLACEVLRLELVVLLDACDGDRWQTLLLERQRRRLREVVEELLTILSNPAFGLETVFEAQNRVFDAVIAQSAEISRARDPSGRRSALNDRITLHQDEETVATVRAPLPIFSTIGACLPA